MAPEIVCKRSYFGRQIDVWAIGILLYVIVCGFFPFKGVDEGELFREI